MPVPAFGDAAAGYRSITRFTDAGTFLRGTTVAVGGLAVKIEFSGPMDPRKRDVEATVAAAVRKIRRVVESR